MSATPLLLGRLQRELILAEEAGVRAHGGQSLAKSAEILSTCTC